MVISDVSQGRSSSVGESTRLISAGSTVRIRPPAPNQVGSGRQAGQVGSAARRPTCPTCQPSRPSGHVMELLDRVRQYDPPARPRRRRHARRRRAVRRIGLGRARASAARARRGRRAAARRARALQSSASRGGGRRRAVLRDASRRRSACRCSSIAKTSRRARARERRSIEDAARRARHEFFERARVALRRRRRRARPHARRSGRNVSAAPAARRRRRAAWRRCIRGTARSSGRCSTAAAPSCARTSTTRGIAVRRRRDRTTTSRFRATASAPSCCRSSRQRFNPAIVDVLADEAELAREDVAVDGAAAARARGTGSCRRDGRTRGASTSRDWTRCRWRCAALVLWRAMIEAAGRPTGVVRPRRGGAAARRRRAAAPVDVPGPARGTHRPATRLNR